MQAFQKMLFLSILLSAPLAQAQSTTWVIPVFAEQVRGAYGSTWQSELRLTNVNPDFPASALITRLMPQTDSRCTAPSRLTIPRGTFIIRSVGCGSGTLAAVEIAVEGPVRVDSVLYQTTDPIDDPALTGVSTTIPIAKTSEEYPGGGWITNLVVNRRKQRVNLFLFGLPTAPALVRIDIFDAAGEWLQTRMVPVTPDRLGVVTDVLSGNPDPCCVPSKPFPESGAFNITINKVEVGNPSQPDWLAIASVVDNTTNDSTIFTTGQMSFSD